MHSRKRDEKSGIEKVHVGVIITQLKGIMTMPFLNSIYTSEVWNIYYQEQYYLEKYKDHIIHWIDNTLVETENVSLTGNV